MDLDDGWGEVIFITIVEGYQGTKPHRIKRSDLVQRENANDDGEARRLRI